MKQEKTTLEYLQERKEMAYHNLLCYSKSYAMDTPKDGMEQAFAEALRDVEIVEELVSFSKITLAVGSTETAEETIINNRKMIMEYYVNSMRENDLGAASMIKERIREMPLSVFANSIADLQPDVKEITYSMKLSFLFRPDEPPLDLEP